MAAADYEMDPSNFDYEETKNIIEQSLDTHLGTNVYSAKKVHDWTTLIVESVLKGLQASNKPFKYVVTAVIMQKTGAGLHTASTCFWDTQTDASCSVRWDNKTMHAICTVYALKI
jgi:dynein light chain Tctex-type 1/3